MKRMKYTELQKRQIEQTYITTGYSLKELSKVCGIPISTLTSWYEKRGWKEKRIEFWKKQDAFYNEEFAQKTFIDTYTVRNKYVNSLQGEYNKILKKFQSIDLERMFVTNIYDYDKMIDVLIKMKGLTFDAMNIGEDLNNNRFREVEEDIEEIINETDNAPKQRIIKFEGIDNIMGVNVGGEYNDEAEDEFEEAEDTSEEDSNTET